ncbi:hypothetical protein HCH04_11195 [Bacteroides thetaiotaomicron]|uniref:hypothetical protein n=1 Tax=Bacteroides thetaiotaomicron TaxID=818 RepID=UPI0012476CA1|nr:hypothetical protein [Bacteroides thetaiotaomicron]MBX9048889.1 hypothetical protein [Bacteroides thetaiotaomicron]MBX9071896.1 hypothetical protein [Bacteroides thetaiotaomicron]
MPNTVLPGRRAEGHIMLNIPHGRNAPEDIKYNVPSASPISLQTTATHSARRHHVSTAADACAAFMV